MGNGNKKLLVLSEAGEGIGYGHYMRCYAIKSYVQDEGVPCDFFLDVKGSQYSQFKGVSIVDWQCEIGNINTDREYSHVLVDSYLAPLSIFEMLTKQFEKVVALDDYHRIDRGPHLIINPNIFGDKVKYGGWAVGGSKFIILRNAFRKERRKFSIRNELSKILITLGGSDVRKLMPTIIGIVLTINPAIDVEVVAGNDEYCEHLKTLFASMSAIRFHGFVGEEQMKHIMLESDLAVSGCGQTLHELAWLGVPTIGICVGDDQIMNMKEYVSRKFLNEELYWNSPDFRRRLESNIIQLKSPVERRRSSDDAEHILDNKGLYNIYNEVFS